MRNKESLCFGIGLNEVSQIRDVNGVWWYYKRGILFSANGRGETVLQSKYVTDFLQQVKAPFWFRARVYCVIAGTPYTVSML